MARSAEVRCAAKTNGHRGSHPRCLHRRCLPRCATGSTFARAVLAKDHQRTGRRPCIADAIEYPATLSVFRTSRSSNIAVTRPSVAQRQDCKAPPSKPLAAWRGPRAALATVPATVTTAMRATMRVPSSPGGNLARSEAHTLAAMPSSGAPRHGDEQETQAVQPVNAQHCNGGRRGKHREHDTPEGGRPGSCHLSRRR